MDQRDYNNQPQSQPYNNQVPPQAYNYNQPQSQPYNNQMPPQAYNYNPVPQQPYNYNNQPRLRFNAAGLIGMLFGIFGAVSMFIPYIWILAFLNAITALILGIVGVNLKGRKKGMAKAGMILGIIELSIFVIIIVIALILFLLFGSVGILSEIFGQFN